MSSTDQFLIALQAFQELQSELHPPEETAVFVDPDPLQVAELPPGSLLLGLGEDVHPLTLDLYDPAPGPILVAGDGGCGKTTFLKSLAAASDSLPDVQFGVVTPFPEEWKDQEALPGCLGIWPSYHPSSGDFLERLVSWAEVLPATRQAVLLFVDGLDLMLREPPARHQLRWLLAHGPGTQVWPLVTVNPGHMARLGSMLDYFTTRILGHTRTARTMRLLTDDPALDLCSLAPGVQFYLVGKDESLRFWIIPMEGA
jgi:NACHT domain